MLNKIAVNLTNYIYKQAPDLDVKRKDYMRYSIEAILGEASKFILLAIFFHWIGFFKDFVISLLIFTSLRIFGGGYHFNHYWTCFFSTLFFFIATVFYGHWLEGQFFLNIINLIISILLIAVFAPVPSKKRPIHDLDILKKHRKNLFLVLTLEIILFLFVDSIFPLSLFASTLALFTIQLIIGGFSNEIKEESV